MKNIHVLPTDKPSRLIKQTNGKLRLSDIVFRVQVASEVTQNIYITSDEEIKIGDYFYQSFDSIIHKCYKLTDNYVIAEKPSDYPKKICKKIILTTDTDLIKDGVQAIDDEFLEWFVKNPSCEYVETYSLKEGNEELGYHHYKYEIVIPKEKPKQQTLEEVAFNKYPRSMSEKDAELRNEFIAGAKWQQERMYSEEEVRYMLQSYAEWSIDGDCTYYEWFEQFKKE